MLEIFAAIIFILLAFALFAGGLHFSKYKKRENAGCCGGGSCSADGKSSCYSSKEEFVDNFDKIKAERLEASN
ncbi:MAG: hypothetical protein R3250_08110 [Melioribacteraceae bacterium]|nr:hypothetical protein [Melioribacteraceae bacterium]